MFSNLALIYECKAVFCAVTTKKGILKRGGGWHGCTSWCDVMCFRPFCRIFNFPNHYFAAPLTIFALDPPFMWWLVVMFPSIRAMALFSFNLMGKSGLTLIWPWFDIWLHDMQLVLKISKAGLSWEILHFNVNMPSSIFCVDMTTTRMMWSVQRLYQVRHEYCQTHSPLPVLFLMEPHDGTSGDPQERPWILLQDAPRPLLLSC